MGFLAGKRFVITGLLSNRSIAYGVAKAMEREGAELAFTYVNEKLRERVESLVAECGGGQILYCDVASDSDIDNVFQTLRETWGTLDGVIHSIGFAPREALDGHLLDGLNREAFRVAHEISAYSFPALVKAALPLCEGRQAAFLSLSYLGAVRVVPHYNVMGLAKASLEASVRYLASAVGKQGHRVNGISAGPIKTLAAAGISDFGKIFKHVEANAPLRRNVTIEEVGNVAAFLCSDLASGVTGEITYVDAGYNVICGGLSAEEG